MQITSTGLYSLNYQKPQIHQTTTTQNAQNQAKKMEIQQECTSKLDKAANGCSTPASTETKF